MMAPDYARIHEFYLRDMPPPSHYNHYDMTVASSSTAPGYDLTAIAGTDCNAGVSLTVTNVPRHPPPMQQGSLPHHDQRKRKSSHYSTESYEMPVCSAPMSGPPPPQLHPPMAPARKRKTSSYGSCSTFDDDGGDDAKSGRSLPDKKQNHSEIEKRRRDKMNTYISELSAIVPMCGAMARKLDKLTVLRMAVQHLRSVRGALTACPLTARPRPAFISERELNSLVLQAAHDCFLLVVGCDRGRLLYVSASVTNMLHYEQSELLGQSLFDILHPKDVAKVKEQLSSSDLSPRERLIDAKTMLPVKADLVAGTSRFGPGARRSFFCRIKCKQSALRQSPPAVPIKEETEAASKMHKKQASEKKYCVVQCTGYLKSWAPIEMSDGASTSESIEDSEACNLSCLVAVVRALPDIAPLSHASPSSPTRALQYVSRLTPDGKFMFVDQRVTLAIGFLPQELLGTSLYEYVSGPELGAVARTHKSALSRREPLFTPPYLFRKKDGTFARIQTHFKPFKNPWTKDVECLVANNSIVAENNSEARSDTAQSSYDLYTETELFEESLPLTDTATYECKMDPCLGIGLSEADVEMQRLIESQVESHKIGSAIAEEALGRTSTVFSPELPTDLLHDVVLNQQWPLKSNLYDQPSLVDNILGVDVDYDEIRNNVTLSAAGTQDSPPPEEPLPCDTPPSTSPPLPPLGLDGNGEAAMAVIMSLLEADAGLGGPVNFSGLPWPLP